MTALLKQFIRFSLSGVVGFIVDAGIVTGLTRLIHMWLIPAQLFAFLVAVTITWAINRRFTFWHGRSHNKIKEWIHYLGANAFGGAINNGVFSALVLTSPLFSKAPILAIAGGSIAGLAFNFSSAKLLIFVHNSSDDSGQ